MSVYICAQLNDALTSIKSSYAYTQMEEPLAQGTTAQHRAKIFTFAFTASCKPGGNTNGSRVKQRGPDNIEVNLALTFSFQNFKNLLFDLKPVYL